MYGKLFASLYQGTLRGNAHGILVFTNLIAHCDQYGHVDKHFRAIAEEVGLTVEQVKAAIDELEQPDSESRSPELEGRRIVRLDEHRAWGWKIVNYLKYRSIRNEEDRREQNRQAQKRFRDARKSKPESADVSQRNVQSAQEEAEAKVEEEKKKIARKRAPKTHFPDDFCISDRVKAWAIEKGHRNLEDRLEQFIGYVKRSGKTYADWDEAFMSAIREDWAKLGTQRSTDPPRKLSIAEQAAQDMRKAREVFGDD